MMESVLLLLCLALVAFAHASTNNTDVPTSSGTTFDEIEDLRQKLLLENQDYEEIKRDINDDIGGTGGGRRFGGGAGVDSHVLPDTYIGYLYVPTVNPSGFKRFHQALRVDQNLRYTHGDLDTTRQSSTPVSGTFSKIQDVATGYRADPDLKPQEEQEIVMDGEQHQQHKTRFQVQSRYLEHPLPSLPPDLPQMSSYGQQTPVLKTRDDQPPSENEPQLSDYKLISTINQPQPTGDQIPLSVDILQNPYGQTQAAFQPQQQPNDKTIESQLTDDIPQLSVNEPPQLAKDKKAAFQPQQQPNDKTKSQLTDDVPQLSANEPPQLAKTLLLNIDPQVPSYVKPLPYPIRRAILPSRINTSTLHSKLFRNKDMTANSTREMNIDDSNRRFLINKPRPISNFPKFRNDIKKSTSKVPSVTAVSMNITIVTDSLKQNPIQPDVMIYQDPEQTSINKVIRNVPKGALDHVIKSISQFLQEIDKYSTEPAKTKMDLSDLNEGSDINLYDDGIQRLQAPIQRNRRKILTYKLRSNPKKSSVAILNITKTTKRPKTMRTTIRPTRSTTHKSPARTERPFLALFHSLKSFKADRQYMMFPTYNSSHIELLKDIVLSHESGYPPFQPGRVYVPDLPFHPIEETTVRTEPPFIADMPELATLPGAESPPPEEPRVAVTERFRAPLIQPLILQPRNKLVWVVTESY